MADLEAIAAEIRRQRQDIKDQLESTSSRSIQAAELIDKIEDLRKRVEKTRVQFPDPDDVAG